MEVFVAQVEFEFYHRHDSQLFRVRVCRVFRSAERAEEWAWGAEARVKARGYLGENDILDPEPNEVDIIHSYLED